MKKYADARRQPLEFNVGDKMLLKLTPQIWKKINSKMVHQGLVPKYDKPFEVMKQMGQVAYQLRPPERLKIHPIFHVSFLKPFNEDLAETGRQQAKHAPPIIRKQYDKEVERILDHKTMGQSKKNRRTEFLVQWKGGAAKRMLAGKRKYLCGNSSGRLKRTWTPCRRGRRVLLVGEICYHLKT